MSKVPGNDEPTRLPAPLELDEVFLSHFSGAEQKDIRKNTLHFLEIAVAAVALHTFTEWLQEHGITHLITYPLYGIAIFAFFCDVTLYFFYLLIATARSLSRLMGIARRIFLSPK